MSKRIFGKVKGLPKPKTPEQWHALYLKHQVFLPHVSRLALFFSRFGPGTWMQYRPCVQDCSILTTLRDSIR